MMPATRTVKRTIDDLALFGGSPAFPDSLYVGQPNIGDRDRILDMVGDILDSRWFTNHGPIVREFERRIARMAGTRYCVAMCNATAALQVAIRALGLSGEVIVPSFTFAATPHSVSWLGLTPVFCDIDPATHALDPDLVESLITPRTSAILGVHLWGRPCAVDRLEEISRRHSLALLYDAAHAVACTAGGKPIGGFGDATVFSFHATKFLNSFEGGALVTDDADLARRAGAMYNFGLTGEDEVSWSGTNGKMSEVAGAMGLISLDAMADIIAGNRANWTAYRDGLADLPGLDVIDYPATETNNYQYVVIEVDERHAGVDRDLLRDILQAERIMCRRYFYPGCHMTAPYRGTVRLPHTETLAARVLQLPTGMAVTGEEVGRACEVIRFVLSHGAQIRRYATTR